MRVRAILLTAVVAAAATLPVPAQAERLPPDVVVDLHPPDDVAPSRAVTVLEQRGSGRLEVSLATLDGGSARWAEGWGGELVVDLPEATSDQIVPRAVLSVRDLDAPGDPTEGDALTPGRRPFSFGADFRTSLVRMGRYDDGDNIIQRGLASDGGQYKIEVAGGRVSCVLIGTDGALRVHTAPPVDPRYWYTARCSRLGEAVVLWVAQHRRDGTVATFTSVRHGPLGSIEWPTKRPPLAVGGKLAANGEVIRSATDQLNGLVAGPVLVVRSVLAPTCGSVACPYAVVT